MDIARFHHRMLKAGGKSSIGRETAPLQEMGHAQQWDELVSSSSGSGFPKPCGIAFSIACPSRTGSQLVVVPFDAPTAMASVTWPVSASALARRGTEQAGAAPPGTDSFGLGAARIVIILRPLLKLTARLLPTARQRSTPGVPPLETVTPFHRATQRSGLGRPLASSNGVPPSMPLKLGYDSRSQHLSPMALTW